MVSSGRCIAQTLAETSLLPCIAACFTSLAGATRRCPHRPGDLFPWQRWVSL